MSDEIAAGNFIPFESRPVAQLAERRSPKPQVGGSIPSWPATNAEMDKVKIFLAVACVVLGLGGYYYFSETALVLRVLMVVGGLVGGGLVGWTSAPDTK